MEHELSEVQKMILEVFEPVYKYLTEHKVEYYMLGGTLLGAVRHQGFIPWDDDIDLGIPRGQYESFLKGIAQVLPSYMKVETYRNTRSHHYYFSRIVDLRHTVKRLGSMEERSEYVWIDIFPLDGMPNNKVLCGIHKLHLLWVKFLYHCSCFEKVNLARAGRTFHERALIAFVKKTGFGRRKSTRKMLARLDRVLKMYPYETSDYERMAIVKAIRYVDEVIPEENWEQKTEDIKKYGIDIFVMGDDWKGKFDDLKKYCEVVYLPRTEGISTTSIKQGLDRLQAQGPLDK